MEGNGDASGFGLANRLEGGGRGLSYSYVEGMAVRIAVVFVNNNLKCPARADRASAAIGPFFISEPLQDAQALSPLSKDDHYNVCSHLSYR